MSWYDDLWDGTVDVGRWLTNQGKGKQENTPGSTGTVGEPGGGTTFGGGATTNPVYGTQPGQTPVSDQGNNPVHVNTPFGTFGSTFNTAPGLQGTSTKEGDVNLPYFQEDRQRLGGLLKGQSPFAGKDWNGLIKQLQDRASGKGSSLSQQNYSMANQNTINALSSMSRGSANPDAARQAMIQQGRVGQGQAAGLALAGTQEQMAAQSGLQEAMGTRDKINSMAYQQILGQQLGLSSEQMKALMGNAGYLRQDAATNAQSDAARNQQLAMLAIAMAKMYGDSA